MRKSILFRIKGKNSAFCTVGAYNNSRAIICSKPMFKGGAYGFLSLSQKRRGTYLYRRRQEAPINVRRTLSSLPCYFHKSATYWKIAIFKVGTD